MRTILGIILVIFGLLLVGAQVYQDIQFDRNIGGHMTRAATANTIEIATTEMQIVVDNMEAKGYTQGYTSILYTTPNEDVGFWYKNMKASLNELKNVPANASDLEKSKTLMKLERTLESQEESGKKIVTPPGISTYPNNLLWGIISLLGILVLVFGLLLIFAR